jgi:LexA DNA binding domain-containing protein
MNDQRSLYDQQVALRLLAVRHGLYDAADWLRGIIESHAARFSEPLEAPLPPRAEGEREQGQGVPGEGHDEEGRERHRGTLPAGTVDGPEVRARVERFVRSFFDREGYAPSYRRISAELGIRSISTVHAHVHTLVRAGRLRLLPEGRGVRPV